MLNYMFLYELADKAVKSVSSRVAHTEINGPVEGQSPPDNPDVFSLVACGDYSLGVVMLIERDLAKSIAVNMMHGQAISNEDITQYVMEYFNIVCGSIVSSYNLATRASARFGFPAHFYGEGAVVDESGTLIKKMCYSCNDGRMELNFMDYPVTEKICGSKENSI